MHCHTRRRQASLRGRVQGISLQLLLKAQAGDRRRCSHLFLANLLQLVVVVRIVVETTGIVCTPLQLGSVSALLPHVRLNAFSFLSPFYLNYIINNTMLFDTDSLVP